MGMKHGGGQWFGPDQAECDRLMLLRPTAEALAMNRAGDVVMGFANERVHGDAGSLRTTQDLRAAARGIWNDPRVVIQKGTSVGRSA